MIEDGELKQKVNSASQPALPPALQQAVQESSSSSQVRRSSDMTSIGIEHTG